MVVALGLVVAGCGVAGSPLTRGASAVRGLDAGTIVDLPGVPLHQALNLTGKYQKYDLTGSGAINTLDAGKLDVAATIVAHWGFFSQTKQVTFSIANRLDAQYPYAFLAVNVTDHQSYPHNAKLTSHDTGKMTFTLDDNTTAVITADGQGNAGILYGDFNLAIGGAPQKLHRPTIVNPPSREHFFDLR